MSPAEVPSWMDEPDYDEEAELAYAAEREAARLDAEIADHEARMADEAEAWLDRF